MNYCYGVGDQMNCCDGFGDAVKRCDGEPRHRCVVVIR